MKTATVVGAGLAGCEAAFQLAERGWNVTLVEQKPHARTPAQTSDQFCELVCSNSLRGAALVNAVGLLKEELRRCGSLILRSADETAVPAGGALAVDRDRFSERITRALESHARITIERRVVDAIPHEDHPVILATGPLTGDALAKDIAHAIGQEHLAYYDAIAPIIAADSIDWERVYKKSRYDKGDDAAYGNCPMDEAQYRAFVAAVIAAEKVEARAFEQIKYFEGCLPIEVMAARGEMTLAFGPMKPVGLEDPRSGKRPFAVVQLRQEDEAASAYNMVGFQTRMKWPEQKRVFCMIPGLENAEYLRMGSVHRNTFVNAPLCLDARMQLRARANVHLAGQVTGVEGYVESCAGGFLCALLLDGAPPPPKTTALGGLLGHLTREVKDYQPSNITWAHVAPLEARLKKRDRYEAMAERALRDLDVWREQFAKENALCYRDDVVGKRDDAVKVERETGDEVGAAELGRRVAENLRHRRKVRGMSLDDLAKASGVSRAALSQIETCKTNPTVGLLWKIAVGLGVPIAELIGAPRSGSISVLRRGDAQVLRSTDGRFESRPLAPAGVSPLVEVYELRLHARSLHRAEPHAPGTYEIVVVLNGLLKMRVDEETHDLGVGDSISFAADRPHVYENPGGNESRYHNVIVYER